ncbi:unnamed protein product [Phyllotreta striolata]|uniref:Uncharacterized protein n=1 Tax=Phyllotreta striolata TaxID=444603 RepID=A0A9N9TKH7_PHYSR|nr:unnamed protein product [Phyllotreta striolata]
MEFRAVFFFFYLWSSADSENRNTSQAPAYLEKTEQGLWSIPSGSPGILSANFGYNNITRLRAFAFHRSGFVDLESIRLRGNRIDSIDRRAFRGLDRLRELYLQENRIESLDSNTFKANARLLKLDLSSNGIRFGEGPFLSSPSLETLVLSDNRIERIHRATLAKLPNLRYLIVNSNELFLIADGSFAWTNRFVYLSIARTGVYKLSDGMFGNNESYPRVIDLTDTPLANAFDPPLTKVRNKGVSDLINIDKYF